MSQQLGQDMSLIVAGIWRTHNGSDCFSSSEEETPPVWTQKDAVWDSFILTRFLQWKTETHEKDSVQIPAEEPGLLVCTRVKMGLLGEVLTCDPERDNYIGIHPTCWKKFEHSGLEVQS